MQCYTAAVTANANTLQDEFSQEQREHQDLVYFLEFDSSVVSILMRKTIYFSQFPENHGWDVTYISLGISI